MSKWGHCSFLHSVRYSPSLPKTVQILLLTRKAFEVPVLVCSLSKVTPRCQGVMSELDITPGAVCERCQGRRHHRIHAVRE